MLKMYWEHFLTLSCSIICIFKFLLELKTLIVFMALFLCQGGSLDNKARQQRSKSLFVNGRWWNFSCFSWVMEFSPWVGGLWRALLILLVNVKLRRWVTGWALKGGRKQCHPPFLGISSHPEWVRESTRLLLTPNLTQASLGLLTVLKWWVNL